MTEATGHVADDLYYLAQIEMDGAYDLEVRTKSECDTVLVVHTPDGQWLFDDDGSDDDEYDEELRIESAPSGDYKIWIGIYEKDQSCESLIELETF